ncbi:ionotropic receptor 75a-like [Anopheles funestus]|uniref:ionotropic receptor 75a-like n=1 Tax=Anopheles funestus TaxID=62324 RepID=UPI0020C71DBA|nr:ionotropic receptor 75a-like [Anopheles funestus]
MYWKGNRVIPWGFVVVILPAIVVGLAYGTSVKDSDSSETVATFVFRFIRDHKGLKQGIVFGCDQKLLLIYKVLSQLATIGVRIWPVSIERSHSSSRAADEHERFSSTLRRSLEFHQFVLLDMACANAPIVLEQVRAAWFFLFRILRPPHTVMVLRNVSFRRNVVPFLLQASKYELFNASFHWLIIDKNYNSIVDGKSEMAAGSARSPTTETMVKNSVLYDRTDSSMLQSFANGTENDRARTASVNRRANAKGDDTFGLLATMNVSINAEITVARPTDTSYRGFTLYDLWNPGFISGGKLKIEPLGRYTTVDGLLIARRETTVVRRRNMDGLKLKIMTVVTQKPHQPFELYLTKPQNTHLDSVHRYNYGLMSMLKDFYNFTFVNRRTKSWGYLRNGKFDGMIGALSRREVDLGGSPMYFRQERHRVVSYTTRTFIERPCFIFRHPPRNDAVKNPFLLPFEIIVWYLMVGCGTFLAIVLCCSFFVEDAVAKGSFPSVPGTTRKTTSNDATCSSLRSNNVDAFANAPPHRTILRKATTIISPTGTGRVSLAGRNVSPETCLDGTLLSPPKLSPMWRNYWHRETTGISYNGTAAADDDDDDDVQRFEGASNVVSGIRATNGAGSSRRRWKICHWLYPVDCRQLVPCAAAAGAAVGSTVHNCHNKTVPANISSTHRSHPGDGNDGAKCNYKAEKVSKSILLFLGGVCQQGLSEIPHLSSGRCTSFFILLFGYLMYQYYSASIVGTLLMEQPKSIKTLRNLIDSRLTLGIEDIPYSRDYFVRTTDADSLELYRTRIDYYEPSTGRNESHFLAAADGLQLVRNGGYAFHVAISAAYRIIRLTFSEREICELSEIDMFPVWSQWMVAIVQKNSPYRDVITYGLRRLNEAGLMQRQRHIWQEPKPKCVRQIAPTDLIVGLDAVVSAFVLLCGGTVLSVCVLFVEVVCHRIERHRHGCCRGLGRNRFVMMTKRHCLVTEGGRNGTELFYVE